jgi:hypothetical protein
MAILRIVLLAFLFCPTLAAAEPARRVDPKLLGTWHIVSKLDRGTVYVFEKDRLLIYAPDFEAIFEYRVDPEADPPTLVDYFSNPKFAGSGIYRLEKDKLTWRTAEDVQPLRFDVKPKGEWQEVVCERLDEREAAKSIARLKDERLRRKAKALGLVTEGSGW